MDKIKAVMEKGIYKDTKNTKINSSLPDASSSADDILSLLSKWSAHEKLLWNGSKKYESGGVYHGSSDLIDLQNKVFALFARSNPLHPSTFPFIRKMLSEIVAMTITYFNGDPYKQKGLLTSGGTESILMAVRTYKYFAKSKWNANKGEFKPELILPVSAHAAFHKAAEMYEIKTITIDINNNTYKPDPNDIENAINDNTIGIIGSAPDYAHGILDDIDILSEIAYKYNIPFHVDCCLGSYLISTLAKIDKYKDKIGLFDFRLRGVSSISCDTHKFGYATKGTSVLMFRSNELRRFGYFCLPQSTIGLYSTPTLLGSKNGAVMAACWATMMYFGKNGYIKETMAIMDAVEFIKHEIITNPLINKYIKIMGDPVMSVVCWKLQDDIENKYGGNIHVYQISDAMKRKGWSLNNCVNPPCTHLCVTNSNRNASKKFVVDLIASIKDVIDNVHTNKYKRTGGAMYGALIEATMDDQDEWMRMYLDIINDLPPAKL